MEALSPMWRPRVFTARVSHQSAKIVFVGKSLQKMYWDSQRMVSMQAKAFLLIVLSWPPPVSMESLKSRKHTQPGLAANGCHRLRQISATLNSCRIPLSGRLTSSVRLTSQLLRAAALRPIIRTWMDKVGIQIKYYVGIITEASTEIDSMQDLTSIATAISLRSVNSPPKKGTTNTIDDQDAMNINNIRFI